MKILHSIYVIREGILHTCSKNILSFYNNYNYIVNYTKFNVTQRFGNIEYISCIMTKTDFCLCENKGADQLCSNCAIVFATQIVQFLLYLYPKFQVYCFLLWAYRPVCVRPGRKPRRLVFSLGSSSNRRLFSHDAAQMKLILN